MLIDEIKKQDIREDQILHYSFDSMEYEEIKTAKALFAHLKQHLFSGGKTYLFLDEIQEVTSWEKVVNSLMTDYDVDIYVTGSNSRMMSSELSLSLIHIFNRGRSLILQATKLLKDLHEISHHMLFIAL